MSNLESVKATLRRIIVSTGWGPPPGSGMSDLAGYALGVIERQEEEIARLKAELELARGFMPKGPTLAPPSHEPWRKG